MSPLMTKIPIIKLLIFFFKKKYIFKKNILKIKNKNGVVFIFINSFFIRIHKDIFVY
jgi:hypothetical protein